MPFHIYRRVPRLQSTQLIGLRPGKDEPNEDGIPSRRLAIYVDGLKSVRASSDTKEALTLAPAAVAMVAAARRRQRRQRLQFELNTALQVDIFSGAPPAGAAAEEIL